MIDSKMLERFKNDFSSSDANKAVASAIAKVGIKDASFNNEALKRHKHIFSNTTERGKITEQKKSGRCWMFAALNTARVETMRKYNMKTFEFSQNYTLFWDKLERTNYVLDAIIETADEKPSSRVVSHLLQMPLNDGGQWDMFKAILDKYGVVPKDLMPETFHSSNTSALNSVLTSMIRYFAVELREEYAKTKSKEAAKALKPQMLSKVYNILVKALGEVPEQVTFEYMDKDDVYHRLEPTSPQDFFKKVVGWKLDDKISIINAPTKDKPYGKVYTVKHLGNIVEAEPIRYLNAPIEVLKNAAIKSIKNGNPVWFGCDVGKHSDRDSGIMDTELYNYTETLGYMPAWTKEQRLDYGESLLTHAMVLTGVNLDNDGKPATWQVENSWGEDAGKKGMFSMSDDWFDVFVYQIMIDKKYVQAEWAEKYAGELIELAPWDPMGALARMQ
ncbi:MAG: aminopeptidase [Treponema sp.]|nr:MAG: aminopeptidase [Treponema sp.]